MKNLLIETDRLRLREFTIDDCQYVYELHSDHEVQKYTGEPVVTSLVEVEQGMKERTFKDYNKHGFGRWAVFLKDTKEFIGWAGLKYLPEFDKVDLGYRFKRAFWGKGYATESSVAILEYGFNTLNLECIIAIAMVENKASIRVMEKVGMQFYKMAPYDKGGEDVVWYGKNKSDWNNQ